MNMTVSCMVCNKEFKRITNTHLKTHNIINEVEYLKIYPTAELVAEYTKNQCSINNIAHFIKKYGDCGEAEYNKYKEFLRYKNTYEYKKKKHGWTELEFNEFNLSRAVTLKNCVRRHGTTKGTEVFETYCKKQSSAGCSLEYFQEKYGVVEGKKFYTSLNKKKGATLENYKRLYGDEHAESKLLEFSNRVHNETFHSNLQVDFITLLKNELNMEHKMYSIVDGKEYGIWSTVAEKLFKYDIVFLLPKKICVEINGDFWHCNPLKYDKEYFHPIIKRTAQEIWNIDEIKRNDMLSKGFEYVTIWESEINQDKTKCIEQVLQMLK